MLHAKTNNSEATGSPVLFACGKTLKERRETALWHRRRRSRERQTRRRSGTTRRRYERPVDANAAFESALLPELTALFDAMFSSESEHDREEAAQDCLCQAWLAYSGLPDLVAMKTTAVQLATRVYHQYLAGARFLALAGERGPVGSAFPGFPMVG